VTPSQHQVSLSLYLPDPESPSAQRLAAAAGQAAQISPAVSLQQVRTGPYPERLSLAITTGDHEPPRILYLALPEGPEEPPFLELVRELTGTTAATGSWLNRARTIAQPAELLVFIAPGCPSCPYTVRAALAVAAAAPQVKVTVIDATAHQDLAERYGVRSVPVLVIDGGRSVVGIMTAAELVDLLAGRSSEAYQAQLFASLLEAGRWTEAGHSLSRGDATGHFVELWRESTLETRLRLMLAAEEALAHDPAALDALADQLIPVLSSDDTARRGDTADLLGRIAHPVARPAIEAMLDDPDPEIVEAATEALASFSHRRGGSNASV
jgi:thioredoxin-like negative regulator of GroEL